MYDPATCFGGHFTGLIQTPKQVSGSYI
jgi:hypothetical protein